VLPPQTHATARQLIQQCPDRHERALASRPGVQMRRICAAFELGVQRQPCVQIGGSARVSQELEESQNVTLSLGGHAAGSPITSCR